MLLCADRMFFTSVIAFLTFCLILFVPANAMRVRPPSTRRWASRLTDNGDLAMCVNTSRDLKISPPWNAPHWLWSFAWKLHSTVRPLLHAFDKCSPADTCVNLSVLWWKAIAGNRWGSCTYDGGFAFDLLPSWTRAIVSFPLCYLYPNLHHQNVAMRTLFLDRVIKDELAKAASNNTGSRTKVITLGGGFDSRSLRYGGDNQYANVDFYELDLPQVIEQKAKMIERFQQRRKKHTARPILVPVDLNDIAALQTKLASIFAENKRDKCSTIFVSEAVLLYLQPENVGKVLQSCTQIARECSTSISYCFADRLVNRNMGEQSTERDDVAKFLEDSTGLQLQVWLPKPGKARHMGVASFSA